MNDLSASRAEPPVEAAGQRRILVWDAPVRVFHWLMVLTFAGAYLTAESEHWRLLHITLGYTMMGLLGFRIVWGLVGTRYSRFAQFVRGPAAVMRYLRAMLRGRPEHYTGHNPAGALAIMALLGLALAVTASGWALYNDFGGHTFEEMHEAIAGGMLALVGVHVAAVLLSSRVHHENLVGAMLTGRKPGRPEEGIRHAWRSVAAMMLIAVVGFWWLQWQGPPVGSVSERAAITTVQAGQHGYARH